MSFENLEDHLWLHIISFLTPTLPSPLSGERGETKRKHVRAPELAALMRTSIVYHVHCGTRTELMVQALHRLASVPLYKKVIADDLTTLMNFIGGPPAHPRIQSKTQLLRHTVHLNLEYTPKSILGGPMERAPDLPYTAIMRDRRSWSAVGRSLFEISVVEVISEVERQRHGCLLYPPRPYFENPFPKLRSLAVGAIWGGQDTVWREVAQSGWVTDVRVQAEGEPFQIPIPSCQAAMVTIFSRSPITHFCQRGTAGCYSLPNAFHWLDETSTSRPPTKPLITVHYSIESTAIRLPAAIDCPTQWLLEGPIGGSDQEFGSLLEIENEAFWDTRAERDRIYSDPRTRRDARKRPTFEISFYGNTASLPSLSAEPKKDDERAVITKMNNLLQAESTSSPVFKSGEADKNCWKLAAEAKPCLSCGWAWKE